jgi:hypothetical protein
MSGFMVDTRRRAWLMAHGALFIPLMTTNVHEYPALERIPERGQKPGCQEII